jgi:hypothetical protein
MSKKINILNLQKFFFSIGWSELDMLKNVFRLKSGQYEPLDEQANGDLYELLLAESYQKDSEIAHEFSNHGIQFQMVFLWII